jgi:endonuclease/exonuclease/phosphatase family metal-dependent hydrolase
MPFHLAPFKLLLAAVVVMACSGSSSTGPSGAFARLSSAPEPIAVTPDPRAIKLRVMTYNVNFGLEGDRAGLAAIASASPDLVLLQETTPAWETALVAGLGATFPHHRFEHPRREWVAGGLGILSRWPIVSIERLDPPVGAPFFAWRVIVDAPGGTLQLVNVHLHPPISHSGSWILGYVTTRPIRQREAEAHVARLDPALPTIVLGDFNEEDDGMALAVFRARGFTNALPQFQPDADTWQWPLGTSAILRFRLDHILYDEHFRAIGAAVVDRGRSDHAPVWADLERR